MASTGRLLDGGCSSLGIFSIFVDLVVINVWSVMKIDQWALCVHVGCETDAVWKGAKWPHNQHKERINGQGPPIDVRLLRIILSAITILSDGVIVIFACLFLPCIHSCYKLYMFLYKWIIRPVKNRSGIVKHYINGSDWLLASEWVSDIIHRLLLSYNIQENITGQQINSRCHWNLKLWLINNLSLVTWLTTTCVQ